MENREIDKLIAVKVMGYRFDSTKQTFFKNIGHGWENPVFDFHPSENISSAWSVVDKLKEKYSSIEIFIVDGMTNVTVTERFPNGQLKQTYQGYEESASLSICKAALKAVGVEV